MVTFQKGIKLGLKKNTFNCTQAVSDELIIIKENSQKVKRK